MLVDRAPEEEIPGPAERADPAAGRPAGSAAGDIWGWGTTYGFCKWTGYFIVFEPAQGLSEKC